MGISTIIWFLIRVVPKPNRIHYPCQRVAVSIAFSFVSYLSGLFGLLFFFRKTNLFLKRGSYKLAILSSLGVHEYWNNPHDKQYNRNINKNGTGIEIVQILK